MDIPEVSLIAILDADKEGFLRSETSLIQTIGRAARNEHGRVIMYADKITDSMRNAIDETKRRREIQDAYNKEHGIIPKTVKKDIRAAIEATQAAEEEVVYGIKETDDIDELKANVAGRAARNEHGRVIMYADKITDSMRNAIDETKRRREIQDAYNKEHGIIPKTVKKDIRAAIEATQAAEEEVVYGIKETDDIDELKANVAKLTEEMMEAAKNLQFERAAELRDKLKELEEKIAKKEK